ncbi:MAG: hypothetical protein IT271_06455, partial [Chitinophagales bacterium]|nr:hypothetical protein [Chitinophagales bacterium]
MKNFFWMMTITTNNKESNNNKSTMKMDLYTHQGAQMIRKYLLLSITTLLFLTQVTVNAQSLKQLKDDEVEKSVKEMLNRYDKQIYFTENKGQWPENVIYKADFKYGQAIATQRGMLVGTFDPASIDATRQAGDDEEEAIKNGTPLDGSRKSGGVKGHGWLMNFLNASPSMKIESSDIHKEKFNYFVGNDNAKFSGSSSNYQEIWYKNVYNNVDVRYYPSEQGTLEYDIVCKPGFDKNKIAIQFDGIEQMSLTDKGVLTIKTSVSDVTFPEPIVYQTVNGKRVEVEASYVVTKNNVLSFNLGKYDEALPLIIDPIALRWATWITNNSDGEDHGHGIWVDQKDGSIYILARIIGSGLITQGPFQSASAGNLDIVLGKYSEPATVGGSGTRVWQTYLGGSGDDNPYALEQGPDGNIYVTGYTSSSNYPLIGGGAFSGNSLNANSQTANNIFITKINQAGNSIKSAVIGGNASEQSFDLRFDPSGDIIVGGYTSSTNLGTQYAGSGASNTNNGGTDVMLFKINSDLNTIRWMRNYGGSGNDQINIMNVKTSTGDIYIGGTTTSSTNFPLLNARQSTRGGTQSGVLQKINSSGTTQWSSYFSSAANATAQILCMEFNRTQDTLYFGGLTTGLAAANISSSGVYDNSANGGVDFFVAKMGIDQGFKAATYLGGSSSEDNMMGLNTDENNDVYIFGYSPSTNFPVTSDALQSTNRGGQSRGSDKTFTKLSSNLSTLKFSTYYGGTRDDYDPVGERGIKFSNCRIYTVVTSTSNDIPLTQGAITASRPNTNTYEPGLVVWANPPDFINNTITPNQTVCPGIVPGDITGSLPSYLLPTIVRNGVTSVYPALGGANTYQWQSSIDSLNWTDIPGATSQNLSGSLIGPVSQKTFLRRIIGGDACVIEQGFVLYVNTLSATGTFTNTSCQGTKDGTITITPKNGTPGYTYLWSDGVTSQNRTGLGEGVYTVTITDASNCKVVKTFTIVYTYPKPNVTASAAPSTICQGQSTTLSFSSDIAVSVIGWFNNCSANGSALSTNTTLTVSPSTSITYSVIVQTANGCKDTACVTVTVNTKPEVNATLTQSSVCRTQSSTLAFTPTTGITGVNWYVDDAAAGCSPTGGSLGTNNTLTVSPAVTTAYSVIVQTSAGCKDTACITLNILDCLPEAVRDIASTNEDTPVTIPVLVNDTFGGNGPSTGAITITDNANHGTATVNNGGTPNDPTDDQISYVPNTNYNGNDTLIYQICDSDNDCDTAIVYITIVPVDDFPIANADVNSTNEDSPITNATVVPNDV